MSEFVFWDSDIERFSVCESDSQKNTLPPTLQRHIYGVGGGLIKGLFGTQICAGLYSGPFYVRNFTAASIKFARMCLLTGKREIKRAHVPRAFENMSFCMFIRDN